MSGETKNIEQQTGVEPATKSAQKAVASAKADNLSSMQEELLNLELTAKRLEVEEKKLNLTDIQERIDERHNKRENIRQQSLTNGATLKALAETDRAVQRRCNHKKGGNGAAGVTLGQGDSDQYAVIKHIVLSNDMWIRCTRCGKTWKPPVKEHFNTIEEYVKVLAEYEQAKLFPTKNGTSSSQLFRFSDNGAFFREVTRYTTLR